MNPGTLPEEVGQTARGMIDALKNQPLLLSLVLLNMAMIIFMFYYIGKTFEARTSNLEQLYKGEAVIFNQWADMLKAQQELAKRLETSIPIEDLQKIIELACRQRTPTPPLEPLLE